MYNIDKRQCYWFTFKLKLATLLSSGSKVLCLPSRASIWVFIWDRAKICHRIKQSRGKRKEHNSHEVKVQARIARMGIH